MGLWRGSQRAIRIQQKPSSSGPSTSNTNPAEQAQQTNSSSKSSSPQPKMPQAAPAPLAASQPSKSPKNSTYPDKQQTPHSNDSKPKNSSPSSQSTTSTQKPEEGMASHSRHSGLSLGRSSGPKNAARGPRTEQKGQRRFLWGSMISMGWAWETGRGPRITAFCIYRAKLHEAC